MNRRNILKVGAIFGASLITGKIFASKPKIRPVEVKLNLDTSELMVYWNNIPGLNHVVVSYEYNLEVSCDANGNILNRNNLKYYDNDVDGFIMHYYPLQFVQDEKTNVCRGEDLISRYVPLECSPIVKNTVTGTIYRNDIAVATFIMYNGVFKIDEL